MTSKCLICPVHRRNPLAHPDCANLQLARIKDVRDHLALKHTQTCRDAKGMVVFEGLDEEKLEKLKKRAKRGDSREEQWGVLDRTCHPAAPQLPAEAALQGDKMEEAVRIMLDLYDTPAFAQKVNERVAAAGGQAQMTDAVVINAFFAAFLEHKNTIIPPTAPPPVTGRPAPRPDQSSPGQAVAVGTPIPATTGTAPAVDAGVPAVPNPTSPGNALSPGFGFSTQVPAMEGFEPRPPDSQPSVSSPTPEFSWDPFLAANPIFAANPFQADAGGQDPIAGFAGYPSPPPPWSFTSLLEDAVAANHQSPSDLFREFLQDYDNDEN